MIGEFVCRASPPIGYIAHVFKTSLEGEDGFVAQLFLGGQFAKQRQFEGLSLVAP